MGRQSFKELQDLLGALLDQSYYHLLMMEDYDTAFPPWISEAYVIEIRIESRQLRADYQRLVHVVEQAAYTNDRNPAPVIGRPLKNLWAKNAALVLQSFTTCIIFGPPPEPDLEQNVRAVLSATSKLSWRVWVQSINYLRSLQSRLEPRDKDEFCEVSLLYIPKADLTQDQQRSLYVVVRNVLDEPFIACGPRGGRHYIAYKVYGWSSDSQIVEGEEVFMFIFGVKWKSKQKAKEFKKHPSNAWIARDAGLELRKGDDFYDPIWRYARGRHETFQVKWEHVGPHAIRKYRHGAEGWFWSLREVLDSTWKGLTSTLKRESYIDRMRDPTRYSDQQPTLKPENQAAVVMARLNRQS